MKKLLWALLLALLPCAAAAAQEASLPEADRIRIAEVFRLAEALQDSIWTGWSQAPFALLLVTSEHEFLVRHPRPSEDFEPAGYDSLLQSEVYVRERVYSPHFLATFPAVGGVPTIVIGQPENTDRSSTFWVLTALHEHFHQLQYAQPDYYAATNALGLARGDETGMWMLNFPFPYDSTVVVTRFAALNTALLQALRNAGTPDFDDRLSAYLDARVRLQEVLTEDDYKYLSFQLWQEGVARYTEYKVAEAAAAQYTPTEAFRSLDDFVPFEEAADSLYKGIVRGLSEPSLDERQRVAFYPVGAAEALLLDSVNPAWKQRYFEDKFDLKRLYDKIP